MASAEVGEPGIDKMSDDDPEDDLLEFIFPPTKHILSEPSNYSKKSPLGFRVHSRSNPLSVYNNVDPIGIRPLSDQEKLSLANGIKYDPTPSPTWLHPRDSPIGTQIGRSVLPLRQREGSNQTSPCSKSVPLWALAKGAEKYWTEHHMHRELRTTRLEKENSKPSLHESEVLRKYHRQWMRKQVACTKAREQNRTRYLNLHEIHVLPFPEEATSAPFDASRPKMANIDAKMLDFSISYPEPIFRPQPNDLSRKRHETELERLERLDGLPLLPVVKPEWLQSPIPPETFSLDPGPRWTGRHCCHDGKTEHRVGAPVRSQIEKRALRQQRRLHPGFKAPGGMVARNETVWRM
ncbi:MAG: hypothetical protein M4579_002973 [Chaenotheca gracillima]|nr:MAG: hypothetical protein M4579_002973 [Chaenotheca gracillima]